MKKIQSTILTMKIGDCHIKHPYNYNANYLNGNIDYIPPDQKLVILFGTLLEM